MEKHFRKIFYFSEMLFSGKENVFMCLVVFQKIFWKIFSGVWKRRRKRQTQKNTDKTQIDARRSTKFDGEVLRKLQSDDRAFDRDPRSLDCLLTSRVSSVYFEIESEDRLIWIIECIHSCASEWNCISKNCPKVKWWRFASGFPK